jgi:polyribonucleotide nucleotidyltransferase
MDKKISKSCEFAGTKLSFEVGELAPRTNAAVLASMGETVVLATVVVSSEDTDRDYFPLSVEFIEKFYAGGVISGSRFVKRERFPSEEAILKARMIDRSLRPLFPQDFRKDIQIVITVLSYDDVNDPVIIGINAASVAVCLSGVPFDGPIAGLKIGLKDDQLVLNPKNGELESGDMEFIVSGSRDNIIMIDAGANEVSEETVSKAFDLATSNFPKLINLQNELIEEVKIEKIDFELCEVDPKLVE